MAVNDKVKKADYNDIRNTVASIVGISDGSLNNNTYGWGQAVLSSAVSESNKIAVNDWVQLRYDIINAYYHLTGAAPPDQATFPPGSSIEVPVVHDLIRWDAAGSTPVPYWATVYEAYIETNRFARPPASRRITNNWTSPLKTYSNVWGAGADDELICIVRCEWPTAQDARHFFNSGSTVAFTSSFAPSTPSELQSEEWETVLDTAGTRHFGGNEPVSGFGALNSGNFYRLTNAFTTPYYTISASGQYGNNEYRIYARTPNVADNSSGLDNVVEFKVSWFDGYVDPPNVGRLAGSYPPEDGVYGTLSLSMVTYEAFGTMQPFGTPNFTVVTPTVTVGDIEVAP